MNELVGELMEAVVGGWMACSLCGARVEAGRVPRVRARAREGPQVWRSSYTSVQKLLDHLPRFTKSENSKESYLNLLRRFSNDTRQNPDELTRLPRTSVETLIQSYADEAASRGVSHSYVNTILKHRAREPTPKWRYLPTLTPFFLRARAKR